MPTTTLTIHQVQHFLSEYAFEYQSTHNRLCFPIIQRINLKMQLGLNFKPIKVDGKNIVDGHHRYLASCLSGIQLDFIPSVLSSAKVICEWRNIQMVEEDWDDHFKIIQFNIADAKYNDMPLQQLMHLLK